MEYFECEVCGKLERDDNMYAYNKNNIDACCEACALAELANIEIESNKNRCDCGNGCMSCLDLYERDFF